MHQPSALPNWAINGAPDEKPLFLIPLLARVHGPSVVPHDLIARCRSYRDAVRLCFVLRRVKGMGPKLVASMCGIHVPHMSEFLSDDETKREMPAKYIGAFQDVCANTAVSQYLALVGQLTVLEEMQAARAA